MMRSLRWSALCAGALALALGRAPAHAEEPPATLPGAPEGLTAARLAAYRTYKAGRIVVREESELRGGGTTMVGAAGWGPGPWGWGGYGAWGPVVVQDPVRTVRGWGVYQGPVRLDTPTFARLVGASAVEQALATDLRRLDRRARAWGGVVAVGAVGLLGGVVATTQAGSPAQFRLGNQITLGGGAVLLGGLIGGSLPRAKATELRRDPAARFTAPEAQRLADAHNERLRAELGLRPDEVWVLEVE
jgi:hypothetical protein